MSHTYRIAPAILLGCVLTACSPAPDSSSGSPSGMAIQTAAREGDQSEITPDKITRDLVGHVVEISNDNANGPPAQWTFEADEFRQIEVLERQITPTAATVTVFMTTRDNPDAGEDAHMVSGKLKLGYQRKGSVWTLTTIENLTFHAVEGIST